MFNRTAISIIFVIMLSFLIFHSKPSEASTVYFCLEADCSSMTVIFGGVTHTHKLNCDTVLYYANVPAGQYAYSVRGCGLSGSGIVSVNGTSSYKITMCPPSGWSCCSYGCGSGGSYNCSTCKSTTTTTTTAGTTTTYATTTSTTTSVTTTTDATTTVPPSSAALIVKDSSGNETFGVEDDGLVFTARSYHAQSQYPGFWLDEIGSGKKGAYFVLGEKWVQVQRRGQNFGDYEASPVFINLGAPSAAFVIDETGYVGLGKWEPAHPLQMASGAYCTAGGVWTNASSREYKTDIKKLTTDKALEALEQLEPVEFSYKNNRDEKHVGFIAEDAPDLVADRDRKGMSPMDVVAVLTKAVQEQQKLIQKQNDMAENQQRTIGLLVRKVAELEVSLKEQKSMP
jgi:hypothetical protein